MRVSPSVSTVRGFVAVILPTDGVLGDTGARLGVTRRKIDRCLNSML
jgi:hypothetical protein